MPLKHITRALIRKRSEHNEGIISTLEEISLHQEELCAISEVLGTTCRKLKILYLQNNCIDKMQHLHHMKDLEYLKRVHIERSSYATFKQAKEKLQSGRGQQFVANCARVWLKDSRSHAEGQP